MMPSMAGIDDIKDEPVNDIAAGLRLVYKHPKIDFAKLRLACPYVGGELSGLDTDQLAETLDVIDLLVTNDRSLANWLHARSDGRGTDVVISSLAREEKALESVAREIWFRDLDNCGLVKDIGTMASCGLVKLTCYPEVVRNSNTSQHEIVIDQARNTRYLGGYLHSLTSISADGFACRFAIPEIWDEYDCLSLRTELFTLPCIVIGTRITATAKGDESSLIDLPAEDSIIEPYLVLAFPENYRLQPLIAVNQLGKTVRIAKQLWDKTQIEQVICRQLDDPIAQQRIKENFAWLEELVSTCSGTPSDVGKIANRLTEWLVNKPAVQLQKQESLLGMLSAVDLTKTSLDSYSSAAILLHVLLRLSLISGESSSTGLRVTLCLSHNPPGENQIISQRILTDEGHFSYVEIRGEDGQIYPLVGEGDLVWTNNPITRMPVELYYTGIEHELRPPAGRIYKVLPAYSDFPDIGGVIWGNLVSPFAVVSVGEMEETFTSDLLEMVATVIELEDRPTRTANFPDPWPYNVSKTMKSVVANPNIRYLLILGETEYCVETIERIGSKSAIDAIPDDIHMFIPETLVQAFRQQVLGVMCLQGSVFQNALLWKRLHVLLSQGLQQLGELPDRSCGEGLHVMRNIHRMGESEQHQISDLIGQYVQRINKSRDEKIDAAELRARTARRSQAGLIAMILQHGERKGPDSHGRTYADLLSYRAIIKDITSDLVLPGVTIEQVDSFFQSQWLSPGGLFHTRLTESFGLNQIDNCISRIIETIREGTVSRSVIMTVSHPRIDRKRPLGVNTIHFSFRQLAEKRYQLIGAFEWRTVETLYALPYSMYTTCCFQRFITDECQRLIGETHEISYGEAIFLALNLHVYVDDLNYDIVELILDRAMQSTTNS